MAMDFAVMCQLVRRSRLIRFLFVRSRVCSTLPSDDTSRCSPSASLFLHLHQVGKGTCTLKLRNMLGTHKKAPALARAPGLRCRRSLSATPSGGRAVHPATQSGAEPEAEPKPTRRPC